METQLISLFWNSEERRLRMFWRLLIQGSMWFGLQIGVGLLLGVVIVLAAAVTGWAPVQEVPGTSSWISDLMNRPEVFLTMQAVTLLITIGSVGLAGWLLDRRRFVDFGFHFSPRWWRDLGFGLFLGGFLMAAVFFFELAAGWVEVKDFLVTSISGGVFPLAILLPLGLFIFVGMAEELNSRGYQLKNLAEGMKGSRLGTGGAMIAATLFSSILFGFMHAANPNMTLISLLNLMAAGILLALGYILTGELAIPIGLHITWNFFQGNVFGFPVSGLEPVAARFLAIQQGGPNWLTGGAFGPEGGLIGLGAMVFGCLLIFLWVRMTRGKVDLARALAEYRGRKPNSKKAEGE